MRGALKGGGRNPRELKEEERKEGRRLVGGGGAARVDGGAGTAATKERRITNVKVEVLGFFT